MDTMLLECIWTIEGPLMIGTGQSRAGYADSIVRTKSGEGTPIIPGDAVKGAIRQSAELLSRWLMNDGNSRSHRMDDESFPNNPVVRRIFAPAYYEPFYRFGCKVKENKGKMRFTSTAIEPDSGAAKDHSLRVQEIGTPLSAYTVTITGRGGKWSDPESTDSFDLVFLSAAVLSTEAVGGRKGSGFGRIKVSGMSCTINKVERELEWSAESLGHLREHLRIRK
ncbi:MAG: RAMP superfamily CRISPR-associated protein [Syntrophobacteraceae bacterium]